MTSGSGVWGGTSQSESHAGGDAFIINSEAIEFNDLLVQIGNGWPVATLDRQLWEIDENLMRAELSPTELGEHITRREKLWADREIQVAQLGSPEKSDGYKKPPKQKKGFAASTAAATGMSKTAINLALSRARDIPADVRDQIKGTKLDAGTYLDWLKGMDPDDQRAQVTTDLFGHEAKCEVGCR